MLEKPHKHEMPTFVQRHNASITANKETSLHCAENEVTIATPQIPLLSKDGVLLAHTEDLISTK